MWWLGAVAQGAWDRSRSHLRVEVEWEKAKGEGGSEGWRVSFQLLVLTVYLDKSGSLFPLSKVLSLHPCGGGCSLYHIVWYKWSEDNFQSRFFFFFTSEWVLGFKLKLWRLVASSPTH